MRLFDCFTFYDELDILSLRLELLYPVVDYFVLVESNKTHHGVDKKYFFLENKDKYQKYLDKIVYVQVNDNPPYESETDMRIENFQRNCILRGLMNKAKPDDYILVSDVDEIIKPTILENIGKLNVKYHDYLKIGNYRIRLKKLFKHLLLCIFDSSFRRKCKSDMLVEDLLNYMPIDLECDLFYYFTNYKCNNKWIAPYLVKYSNLTNPQLIRELSYNRMLPVLENSGWHFSYLGGVDTIIKKLNSIADPQKNTFDKINVIKKDRNYLEKCLEKGIDLFGRDNYKFTYIPDESIGIPNVEIIKQKYPHFFWKKNISSKNQGTV